MRALAALADRVLHLPDRLLVCGAAGRDAPETQTALAVGDPAMVQMAGQQRDGVAAAVMAQEMAGHADLPASAAAEHVVLKPGPVVD
jgi:hypothetical protein